MRPLAPRPRRADDAHVRAASRLRALRAGWVATASAVAWALGAGPALAAEAPDVTLTVSGTVYHAMHDADEAFGHAGDGHADEAQEEERPLGGEEPVRTFVEVDGAVHDLTGVPALSGTATGSDVVLTLAAGAGVTADEALSGVAAAAEGTGGATPAELVAVAPVASTAPEVTDEGLPLAASMVTGRTLTVLPVYAGSRDAQTRESLATLASTVRQYWSDQSAGKVDLVPTVRDWVAYTSPATCNAGEIWNNALAAHGVPAPGPGQHVAVYFPQRSDCGGWAGMATVGGGQIWINGVATEDVLAHEVGHNLGLGHANTLTCTQDSVRVTLGGGCSYREYEDRADVMGIGTNQRTGNLTTAAADVLGLVTANRITTTSVSQSVTVDLAPLADVGALRAVSLPAPGYHQGRVYVDFRPAVGRDVRRTAWAGVQLHLRMPDSRGIPQTYLLDAEPATTTAFSSPALARDRSWTVPGTDLTVTVVSSGSTARVTVSSTQVAPTPDTTAPTPALLTAPVRGDIVRGTTVVGWTPGTDDLGVTAYDVLVDGKVVRQVGAATTSVDLGVLEPGPHAVAVDALDGAGNRARGTAVTFTVVADDTQRYVARVYADLFKRSPDRGGLLSWSTALAAGTPRVAVANAITSSDEYRSRLIQASYSTYLGRSADAHGLSSWLAGMRRGLTIQQMEGGFLASTEYYQKAGDDDGQWVTRLYQHVLGRTPAPAEVDHWKGVLATGMSRQRVAMGFLLSTEHLTDVVDGYYRDLLGRGIDPVGRAGWVSAIQRGTRVETIVGGIVASGEYAAR